MIQKLEEDEKERSLTEKSETKTEEDLRRELEAIPNFLEMTPEEIQNWINEQTENKQKTNLISIVLKA